jgi:hypothetical protein
MRSPDLPPVAPYTARPAIGHTERDCRLYRWWVDLWLSLDAEERRAAADARDAAETLRRAGQ